MVDEPIDEQGFMGGVNVVDFGDLRVSRGLTRRPYTSCRHKRLSYDSKERRIWCRDCETDVDPFDAFMVIVENFDGACKKLDRRAQEVADAEAHTLRRRAAKEIDKAWQSRDMVPQCPSCDAGLFPEDFVRGISRINREWAEAQRKRQRETTNK